MARTCSGTAQYFTRASCPITNIPVTMACWANINSLTAASGLMQVATTGGGEYSNLMVQTTGTIRLEHKTSGSGTLGLETVATITTGTWFHAMSVAIATNSYALYLNGANAVTDTGNRITTGPYAETTLAVQDSAGFGIPLNGRIAYPCFWKGALTATDAASLATGAPPRRIRPDQIISYSRLTGAASPEPDMWGNSFTLVGASSEYANPRLYLP